MTVWFDDFRIAGPSGRNIPQETETVTETTTPAPSVQALGGAQFVPDLSVDLLRPSPTQPRKSFDKAELEALTASVRERGVRQPILVRPIKGGNFEIVFGERRVRASRAAERTTIPAMVQQMPDQEVEELQLEENVQREALHAIEEADSIAHLVTVHKVPIERLADRLHRTERWVRERLRLADQPDVIKDLVRADKITASAAVLLSRVSDVRERVRMARGYAQQAADGEAVSLREVAEDVAQQHLGDLQHAPFDTKDADLVPAAGACGTCPKRLGNQPDLFGEEDGNRCLDGACWKDKARAAWSKIEAKATAAGARMAPAKAQATFEKGYQSAPDGFVVLKADNYESPKVATWEKLLGKETPTVTVFRSREGKPLRCVERAAAQAVLREKYDWAKKGSKTKGAKSGASREANRRALEREVGDRLATHLAGLKLADANVGLLQALADRVAGRAVNDVRQHLIRRRGVPVKPGGQPYQRGQRADEALTAHAAALQLDEAFGMALEAAFGELLWPFPNAKVRPERLRLAGLVGFDLEKAEGEAKKELLERERAPKAKPKKGARVGALPALSDDAQRKCRVCACTEENCQGCVERTGAPCKWAEPDLCTACVRVECEKCGTTADGAKEAGRGWAKFGLCSSCATNGPVESAAKAARGSTIAARRAGRARRVADNKSAAAGDREED